MASDVGTQKKFQSETILYTSTNNIVIPHKHPEYGPTAVKKFLGLKKLNLITGKVTTLETIDKTVPQLFNTFELPVEQFSFIEFYHNLREHNLKSKLRCVRISQSNNKNHTSSSDIANFAASLPYMTNTQKGDELEENKSKDYFDDAIMEHVGHHLLQLSSIDGVVTSGPPSAITFHSKITGKRKSEAGKVHYLLHWSPENIVPDTWVTEDEIDCHAEKTIPVSQLPSEALQPPLMDALGLSGIFSKPGKRKRK